MMVYTWRRTEQKQYALQIAYYYFEITKKTNYYFCPGSKLMSGQSVLDPGQVVLDPGPGQIQDGLAISRGNLGGVFIMLPCELFPLSLENQLTNHVCEVPKIAIESG